MSLVAHMDGTQCEEVHLIYMERMGAFFIHALILSFDIGLFRLGFFLLFSRVTTVFSTGCSRARIPPLPLRDLLGEIALYCSTSNIKAKHHSSVPTLFL